MASQTPRPQKIILDLETLNRLNDSGYAGKFCLGDTVVLACGGWEGGPRYVHEHDAVYDPATNAFVERKCYEGRKATN
jgi:hypothetical protein